MTGAAACVRHLSRAGEGEGERPSGGGSGGGGSFDGYKYKGFDGYKDKGFDGYKKDEGFDVVVVDEAHVLSELHLLVLLVTCRPSLLILAGP